MRGLCAVIGHRPNCKIHRARDPDRNFPHPGWCAYHCAQCRHCGRPLAWDAQAKKWIVAETGIWAEVWERERQR